MIGHDDIDVAELRSLDDEPGFFALMGRFFASPAVRRDCGGYPLDDGPRYRWFVLRRKVAGATGRAQGFISVEHRDKEIRIRHGYLRPEARGQGLFGSLLAAVLAYADRLDRSCSTRVLAKDAPFLAKHGFEVRSHRGRWIHMVRNAHARSDPIDQQGGNPVPGTGPIAAVTQGRGAEPDPPAAA